MPPHDYRITYRSLNRTTQQLTQHLATATGTSRWSALRAWWGLERQWHNPIVQVLHVELLHTGCPRVEYPTHWTYACAHFPQP